MLISIAKQGPLAKLHGTVLVVDDVESVRKQMSQILRKAGVANVAEAADSEEAFEQLLAAPLVFAMVICDLEMGPVSGLQLLRLLRTGDGIPEALRKLPFVLATEYSAPAIVAEGKALGIDGFVAKPFTEGVLIKTVTAVFNNSRAIHSQSSKKKVVAWQDPMAIGDPKIDEDHRKFIALINAIEVINEKKLYAEIGVLLQKLGQFSEAHFLREEELMVSVGYPQVPAHAAQHRRTAKKFSEITEQFSSAKTVEQQKECCLLLSEVLNDIFVKHILKEDIKLKAWVGKNSSTRANRSFSDHKLAPESKGKAKKPKGGQDIEYLLPSYLEHLTRRLEYNIPEMPPPESGFTDFDKICEAAIHRRIDKVLLSFQRSNPDIIRELPHNFMQSKEFAWKFHEVVSKLISPSIMNSRQIRALAGNFDLSKMDTENFWRHLTGVVKEAIKDSWAESWDQFKLIESRKSGDVKVMLVKDRTKILRSMLQASNDVDYDLPKIGNREIEIFKSLLDPYNDWWLRLNKIWSIIHDVYEQEKDPRVFQQKAREGALRDSLLDAFDHIPELWGDFLILACHYVFPRISTQFLESFATNFGRNEKAREAYIPYTLHYLREVRLHPVIRLRENNEEAVWQDQVNQLRSYLTGRTTGHPGIGNDDW